MVGQNDEEEDWKHNRKFILNQLKELKDDDRAFFALLSNLTTRKEIDELKQGIYSFLTDIRSEVREITKDNQIFKEKVSKEHSDLKERLSKQEVKMGFIGAIGGMLSGFLLSLFK